MQTNAETTALARSNIMSLASLCAGLCGAMLAIFIAGALMIHIPDHNSKTAIPAAPTEGTMP